MSDDPYPECDCPGCTTRRKLEAAAINGFRYATEEESK